MESENVKRFAALKRIIEESDTLAGFAFDLSIQALIVVSLVSFSFETLPNLAPETRDFLYFFEVGCITIFTIEYALRLFVADRKLGFVFSFLVWWTLRRYCRFTLRRVSSPVRWRRRAMTTGLGVDAFRNTPKRV